MMTAVSVACNAGMCENTFQPVDLRQAYSFLQNDPTCAINEGPALKGAGWHASYATLEKKHIDQYLPVYFEALRGD